jgi:hypothetical protein
MTRVTRACLLLLGLAALTRQAQGQLGCSGATCTVEISMPVTDVLRLSLSSGSVALGAPNDVDYQAGYRDVSGVAVSVTAKSNRPITVQLGALTPTFSYAGSMTNPNKPASHLLWATSAAALPTTTKHFGTTLTLLSQSAGSTTMPLYFRTLWSFASDVPGTYGLTISLTLSAP